MDLTPSIARFRGAFAWLPRVIAVHRRLTDEQRVKLWAPLIALGLVLLLAYLVM